MIELKGVSKQFGSTQAVNEISFKVNEKENLVLLGTSGCGKTTTLKMINRLIEPDAGQIYIGGEDIMAQNADLLRKRIGYVMQNIGLFPHYTVAENIAVVPKLLKWTKAKIDDRTRELIEKLRLPENILHLFPHQLSGGQQQRVGLARALMADPAVLLMDEPFGALDNVTRTSIQQEFKDLAELKRKTIVMVTHDVQEAFELADRICLMDKGAIVQIGTPKALLYQPVNDFARKFLDGQRLTLAFKVTKLKHVWSFLPDATGHEEQALPADLSVWAALETLRSSGKDKLFAADDGKGIKHFNFEQLTKGFNQYQNQQTHG